MLFTYDLTTPIGRVRRQIPDRKPTEAIFNDEEIASMIVDEGGVEKLAVANALESIATDTALVLKYIKTEDLETDGAKVMDSLMKRANSIRDRYADGEIVPAADAVVVEDVFGIVEGPSSQIDDYADDGWDFRI